MGKMVGSVDKDGNGTIDLDEFIALLRSKQTGKYAKMSPEDELKEAFKIFDADNNGTIDADELAKVMKALGENLNKEDIEFMIKSVDIDGDKTIDFKEFQKMMQMKPIPKDTINTVYFQSLTLSLPLCVSHIYAPYIVFAVLDPWSLCPFLYVWSEFVCVIECPRFL